MTSNRILLALAAMFSHTLMSIDVIGSYLQSSEGLLRDVFLSPKSDIGLALELSQDELLKL
jgi:hypothetical protein